MFRLARKLRQKYPALLLDKTSRNIDRHFHECFWLRKSSKVTLSTSNFDGRNAYGVLGFPFKRTFSELFKVSASDMSYAVNINLRQRWVQGQRNFYDFSSEVLITFSLSSVRMILDWTFHTKGTQLMLYPFMLPYSEFSKNYNFQKLKKVLEHKQNSANSRQTLDARSDFYE